LEYGLQGGRFYGQFIAGPAALILLILILPLGKKLALRWDRWVAEEIDQSALLDLFKKIDSFQATKSRERETETRLDPTPMAHTKHNRTNTEPNRRVSSTRTIAVRSRAHSCILRGRARCIKLHADSSFSTSTLQALPLAPLSPSLSLLVHVQMSRHSRRLLPQVGG